MVLHKKHHPRQHSDKHTHRKNILEQILQRAAANKKRILFPEVSDPRIMQAAKILVRKQIVDVHLLGKKTFILKQLTKFKIPKTKVTIHEVGEVDYSKQIYALRKKKGISMKDAQALAQQEMYYACMLLKNKKVDGIVNGAIHPTADTFRPALQLLKTTPGMKTASSYFLMLVDDKVLFYADCAFNIDPNAQQLADIAIATAQNAKTLGFTPKIAFLSFSTKGSAQHESLEKIREATKIVKRKQPTLKVDGELQLDAALVPSVAKQKAKGSPIKGDANILIFPDLSSGNIAYKITQRLAHAQLMGPISQGIKLPVNDLSRGCTVDEIVEVAAMTALQAQQ